MSETGVITIDRGTAVDAVRYIVSMESVNERIMLVSGMIILVGLIIIALVVLSGIMFIRSIVKPIRRLSEISAQIAQGDFSASEKIEPKYYKYGEI